MSFAITALPLPVESEVLAMTCNDCFRLRNQQSRAPGGPNPGQPNPKSTVPSPQSESMGRLGTQQGQELMAQGKNLRL
jgi:hypothetical protein